MRCVMTRVLPEPAPASSSTGPSTAWMPSRCCGFMLSRRRDTAGTPSTILSVCGGARSASKLDADRRGRLLTIRPNGDSDAIINTASSLIRAGVLAGVGQGCALIELLTRKKKFFSQDGTAATRLTYEIKRRTLSEPWQMRVVGTKPKGNSHESHTEYCHTDHRARVRYRRNRLHLSLRTPASRIASSSRRCESN